MPNIGTPSPASTPMLMLDNKYRQMQDWGRKRDQELRSLGLDNEILIEKLKEHQVEVDKRRADIETNRNTVRQAQNLMDLGILSSAEGEEHKWRAVVGKEIAGMMFPESKTDTTRRPFTPGQLKDLKPRIRGFIEAAEEVDIPWGWDRATHTTMLKQYKAWQINVGYYALKKWEQRQVDSEWDAWAATDRPKSGWNPLAQDVRALRAKGPIARGATARFRQTPIGPREVVDPLKDNIIANLPKRKEFLARMPTVGMRPVGTQPESQPEPEPAKLSDRDKEAVAWARQNPKDSRAIKILTLLGVQ